MLKIVNSASSQLANTRDLLQNGEKKQETVDKDKLDIASLVCFTYGRGVLVFNSEFASYLLLRNVRARIAKMLLEEQNGLTRQAMKGI